MKDLIDHLSAAGLSPVIIDEHTVFPSPVESCFLPGTNIQFAWDSTSLGYFKQCPRLYQYLMVDGWASTDDNIHLRFGIEYHQSLHDYETFLAAGANHNEAVHATVEALVKRLVDYPKVHAYYKPSLRLKTRWNLLTVVVWYLDKFRGDPAETIMLNDGRPGMEVSFRFALEWGPKADDRGWVGNENERHRIGQPYLLCGHLDRIVSFNNEPFVMDRKTTTSSLGDYYLSQFEPNNQMTLYTIAGEVVLGSTIKGVIIDAVKVEDKEAQFQRAMTYRTKEQMEEWLQDLKLTLDQAERYAVANYWPMNDTACDKFGGCRFRDVCSKSPKVRQNFLRGSFVQLPKEERWNPLKPR